ncbi:MAG: HvfC/BufC family peptide modification chaperone, partial [Steroidobacteraceae bacterium]
LVGEAFFDRMAVDFARSQPPCAPQLDEYGAAFAEFIGAFPGTETLPYLQELAQFEWQFAALARSRAMPESASPSLLLDDGARLLFAAPLRLHDARYPVDPLREAILADGAARLQSIDLAPADYRYALWRTEKGVNVRPLGAASSRFLAAVYGGADVAMAMAAAADGQGDGAVTRSLAQEIMPAGFVRIERPPSA